MVIGKLKAKADSQTETHTKREGDRHTKGDERQVGKKALREREIERQTGIQAEGERDR